MENSYGIGVKNRYALFYDDDEDPLERIKEREQAKEAKKKKSEKENRGGIVPTETKSVVKQSVPKKTIKETQNIKSEDTTISKGTGKEELKGKGLGKSISERNVKFSNESQEERHNRRNKEDRQHVPDETSTRGDFEPVGGSGPGFGRGGRGRGSPGSTGGGRGGPRGGGRGTGGRGRGFDVRGKREFDRHSGSDKSGVKPVEKRDGAGAHNWGTYKDDWDAQMNNSSFAEEPQEETTVDPQSAGDTAVVKDGEEDVVLSEVPPGESSEDTPVTVPGEDAKELTLDEWRALQQPRQKPVFNIRKPGEGEDLSQWKKMIPLQKEKRADGEEEDDEEVEEEDEEYELEHGRSARRKLLDIDITFSDSRRGGRGRGRGGRGGVGGRGGGGGGVAREREERVERGERPPRGTPRGTGRGRGQGRGPRQSAPRVDDENDFPSLG